MSRVDQVLNLAGNQISGKLKVEGVPKLRALIANDNAITAVKGMLHVHRPSGLASIVQGIKLLDLGATLVSCWFFTNTKLPRASSLYAHSDSNHRNAETSYGAAGLRKLPELNTVVLKNNSFTELGTAFAGCVALEKLSMAHNEARHARKHPPVTES